METSNRRAFLETTAATGSSDQARLKALELIDRLDEREHEPVAFDSNAYAAELAEDAERLTRTVNLLVELGLCDELIEERAQVLAAEMTRERFATVDAQKAAEEPEQEEATEEPTESPEAASGPESAPEEESEADPHSQKVLARQWPNKKSSLRER